jgi:hypothetical protein
VAEKKLVTSKERYLKGIYKLDMNLCPRIYEFMKMSYNQMGNVFRIGHEFMSNISEGYANLLFFSSYQFLGVCT